MVDQLSPAFEAGQAHTDPLEYIEVLRDRRAINARFGELQANIQDEILVFTKPPYATPVQSNVEGVEVAKSHRARSVYEFSDLRRPSSRRKASGASSRRARKAASSPSYP